MKNKTFIKVISLMLMLILCIGTVACANGGAGDETSADTSAETTADTTETPGGSGSNNDTNNNDDTNNNNNLSSDDALFEELRKASEASIAYSGAFTVVATEKSEMKSGEENSSTDSTMKMSVDADDAKYFMTTDSKYSEGSSVFVEKLFTEGGAMYEYEYDKYSGTDPESGETYGEEYDSYTKFGSVDEFMTEQVEEYATLVESFVGELFLAENFTEVTSAFSNVYNQIKTNEINYMKEEGLLEADATMTLSPVVSIGKDAETGETVLTITSHLNVPKVVEYGIAMENYDVTMERKLACKDGKISSVLMAVSMKVSYESPEEAGDDESLEVSMNMLMGCEFDYKFDQAGYDAITVDLPDDPSEIEDEGEGTPRITVHFGESVVVEGYAYEDMTANDVLDEITQDLRYDFGWTYVDDDEVPYVTVKGFYKDAALTQAIDPEDITRDELIALGDIYADYDVLDGYALIHEEVEEIEELSKEFRMVRATMLRYGMDYDGGHVVQIYDPYTFDRDTERGVERKVYVNGELTTADSLTLESGKTYSIKYVDTVKDANVGISYVIAVGMI